MHLGCLVAIGQSGWGERPSSHAPVHFDGALSDGYCWQDGCLAWIGCRSFTAAFGPRCQVDTRIKDAAADFGVFRHGTIAAVLFERSARQPEKAGGFGRAQSCGIGDLAFDSDLAVWFCAWGDRFYVIDRF